jgi:hypothetical protein
MILHVENMMESIRGRGILLVSYLLSFNIFDGRVSNDD